MQHVVMCFYIRVHWCKLSSCAAQVHVFLLSFSNLSSPYKLLFWHFIVLLYILYFLLNELEFLSLLLVSF